MRPGETSDSSVDIRIRDVGAHRVVYLRGDLSMTTAPAIEHSLRSTLLSRELSLVLDLGEVEMIDSSGLGALVSWRQRIQEAGGTIRLMRVPTSLLTLLRLTQMEDRFQMLESEEGLS